MNLLNAEDDTSTKKTIHSPINFTCQLQSLCENPHHCNLQARVNENKPSMSALASAEGYICPICTYATFDDSPETCNRHNPRADTRPGIISLNKLRTCPNKPCGFATMDPTKRCHAHPDTDLENFKTGIEDILDGVRRGGVEEWLEKVK